MINFSFFGAAQDTFIIQSLGPLLCGFAVFVFFSAWRKFAAKWNNWFPLLRKVLQLALYATISLISVATALFLMASRRLELAGALFVVGFASAYLMSFATRHREGEVLERGATLADAKQVAAMTRKRAAGNSLSFGGVQIPLEAEPFHMLVSGSTGAGKSVAIRSVLDTLRARGDTAIIVDSGGEFAARYWDGVTDHILNPFDNRCVAWSPMSELSGVWDAEALARSIVPDGTGEAKEWNGYAQTLVASVMKALLARGDLSLRSMLCAIQSTPMRELEPLLAGTPAASQLDSEKMFGSIRTIAAKYMGCFNYLADEKSNFSVAKFIRESRGGFLYLTYREDQLDSLKNLISFVLDVASRTILSLPPDRDRRIWLIIDEFASIGKVQSIEAIATKARKVGGCLLVGLQSVAQLQARYGEKEAQSILSCLSTWLVLRSGDAETADYMSRYLGEQQIRQTLTNQSEGDSGSTDSLNTSVQTRRLVMASQLQALPDLHGFLRITGGYPVCALKLIPGKQTPDVTETLVMRNWERRPMVDLSVRPTQPSSRDGETREERVRTETPPAACEQPAGDRRAELVRRAEKLRDAFVQEKSKAGGGNSLRLQSILDDLDALERETGFG